MAELPIEGNPFDTLRELRRRNPGIFTQSDAKRLAETIQADGQLDDAERDLLEELTQAHFRKILITRAVVHQVTDPFKCLRPDVSNSHLHHVARGSRDTQIRCVLVPDTLLDNPDQESFCRQSSRRRPPFHCSAILKRCSTEPVSQAG